jgi:hypothetical protein
MVKIFALLAAFACIMNLLFQIDDKNHWMRHTKEWIFDRLGLCNHFTSIRYEEEYNKEGEPFFHHTYRIYYCSRCGKIFKREQLQ